MPSKSDLASLYHSGIDPDDYPLQLIVMGGLDEVGMNCLLLGCGGRWVVIDCGSKFVDRLRNPGVDLVLPNFKSLSPLADRIEGVILTHGHEDHIGAVPYLLSEFDIPLFAPPFALKLLEGRIREAGLGSRFHATGVTAGESVEIAGMRFECIHVAHSIPQALALNIHTPFGNVFHTGDFRFDETPLDGKPYSAALLQAQVGEPPLLLLADSTNIEAHGHTRSDKQVSGELERVLTQHPGRVFVTLFSSNLLRIRSLVELSVKHGRRYLLAGKRIMANAATANQLGLMQLPAAEKLRIDQLDSVADDRVTIILTGSQGEPNSELHRVVSGKHRYISLGSNDLVIFSSRVIPGNEREIFRLMNEITRQGATILHEGISPIHGSGHAKREELRAVLRTLRPENFIPIHGEHRFLSEHAKVAAELGVQSALVATNGDVIGISQQGLRRIGHLDSGPLLRRGKLLVRADDPGFKQRRTLAYCGVLVVQLKVQRHAQGWDLEAKLVDRGFLGDEHGLLDSARIYLLEELVLAGDSPVTEEIAELARTTLRRFFKKMIGFKPVVIPLVEIDRKESPR